MGRSPISGEHSELRKGPWTAEEDEKLREYIKENGHGSWRALPKIAGLNRDGKSCRLRWTNYLRPDIKRGKFTDDEERLIIHLHSLRGNKWSEIARHLPGRTDNEIKIKNYWNTHLRKKLLRKGIDPITHQPRPDLAVLATIPNLLSTLTAASLDHTVALKLHANAADLAKLKIIQNLLQILTSCSANTPTILPPSINNVFDPLPLDLDHQLFNPNQLLPDDHLVNFYAYDQQYNYNHVMQNMFSSGDDMGINITDTSLPTTAPISSESYYARMSPELESAAPSSTSFSASSTSMEGGVTAAYNPWISELLCGDFELKDVQEYN